LAGSRKGERRGGAKPKITRKPPNPARGFGSGKGKGSGKAGKPPGTVDKSKFLSDVGVILNKHRTPLQKQDELEMYFLAVGKRMRLPKEVMLDAMRYLEEMAIDWGQVLQANMVGSAAAKTPEEQSVYEGAVAAAETRMREYLLMAVDVAYKAAPYIHPRLAAVITNPGSSESPLNAIAALFKDLDEAGKPARYIDHDSSEVAK